MATKTNEAKSKTVTIPERWRALLDREDTIYMGPCCMQAPRAWTRCGPAWYVRSLDLWIIVGPGVAMWGTKLGLAQLATSPDCSPTWHASGWLACSDAIVFSIEPAAIEAPYMKGVLALTRWAETLP